MATIFNFPSDLHLRVDQQQDGRREDEDAEDPGAEAEGVQPDAPPRLVTRGGIDEADRDDQGQDKPVDVDRAEDHARPSAFFRVERSAVAAGSSTGVSSPSPSLSASA